MAAVVEVEVEVEVAEVAVAEVAVAVVVGYRRRSTQIALNDPPPNRLDVSQHT